ncbi:Probable pectate lyase 13 [Linum grandiflorum]
MLRLSFWIVVVLCFFVSSASATSTVNLTLPHQHPFPDEVANDVIRRATRSTTAGGATRTGETTASASPTAESDSAAAPWDDNPAYPKPGTLRFGVIQDVPLWIIFAADMTITLRHELIFNSYKTIDGRGAAVTITGHGCLTVQDVSHVIIHNVRIHDCNPSGNTNIASTPSHVGFRGVSDGDGISLFGARNVWIDHCTLSSCADGLIDTVMGSTAITISNNLFSRHDKVMLMGHDDNYIPDKGMQVTVAFNRFAEELGQRIPRCRHGYIHVVNNHYTSWKMYAIGGSASPTINSQGNRYVAPADRNAKEVTKRVNSGETEWRSWNWRSDGDIMVNGAFFVPSGAGVGATYQRATSLSAKSAPLVGHLTFHAGVLGHKRNTGKMRSSELNGSGEMSSSSDGGVDEMISRSGAPAPATSSVVLSLSMIVMILFSLLPTVRLPYNSK